MPLLALTSTRVGLRTPRTAPEFVATSTGTIGGTSASAVAPVPAGTQAGDLMIAYIARGNGTAMNTAAAGWNLVSETANGVNRILAMYWKIGIASEAASYTWTLTGSVVWVAFIETYRPASSSGLDVSNAQTASSPTLANAGVTTTFGADLLIAAYVMSSGKTVNTPPPGMTQRKDTTTTTLQVMTYSQPLSVVGATGSRDIILSATTAGIATVAAFRAA